MKLFIPAVGYRIRLTEKWEFQLYYEHRNKTLLSLVDLELTDEDLKWGGKIKHLTANMPAGTLLEVDRVYVRTVSKAASSQEDDFDSVTFKVIEHPTLKVTKKIRFWAKLNDINTIEYELPENHAASKEKAAEKKKVIKLTPAKIINEFWFLNRNYFRASQKLPKWATKKMYEEFKLVAAEYQRLHEPWDIARHEENYLKEIQELRNSFNCQTLTLPVALATRVKTFEDLLATGHFDYITNRYQQTKSRRAQMYDPTYVIQNVVLKLSCGMTKDVDGCKWRTFKPHKERHYHNSTEPLYDHLWVKVKTSADDTEILEVTAGIDAKADAQS